MSGSSSSTQFNFVYYYYSPSSAAAGIFLVLFGLSSLLHFYQLVRTRTWFMIAFLIGGLRKFSLLTIYGKPNYISS